MQSPSLPAVPAIEAEAFVHEYGAGATMMRALDRVSLQVAAGEFVSLVGPSGCGKTTLLRAAAGLIAADGAGLRVFGLPPGAGRAGRTFGLVTQDPGLLPWRTVAGNVALTAEVTGAPVDVRELLARVGVERFADFHPKELSGGMRQRVALARALAHRPRLLLMDEPFGALDELSREELRLELLRIWERDRVSVLFVTHSIREAVLLSDRVVVMTPSPGRVAADIHIELPRPRSLAMEVEPDFVRYVTQVRAALGSMPASVPVSVGAR